MTLQISDIFFAVVDFFFPSSCIICGISLSNKNNSLCAPCFNKIPILKEKCDICSGAIINGECGICQGRKIYFSKNIAAAEYDGVMKKLLHHYKFGKKRRLHTHLSKLAYRAISEYSGQFDIITSVPVSRKKKWKRGFNQSELIAKRLSGMVKKPYFSLLREKSRHKTQKTLDYKNRFLNILNRYTVNNKKRISGARILIIDDVFTTGSTINECSRILKSFGASSVYSLTLARVDIKRVE